ncbi:SGNH/GDSL hydrolase family protein [Catenulispora pinisilvae]|uniref:SGNH/GDSL hydrolase family protein n=1 Tax=Catenulispora pinisilvae TaxID=2705253 RepID=UPI001E2E74A2|nr:SGNH/GDSL hydrolase family protein [Catenulispora pinisilvae]
MSLVRNATSADSHSTPTAWRRWALRALVPFAALFLLLAALWMAVRITPLQSVTGAGQTVEVGAAAPGLGFSGPGEMDLFGQTISTQPHFPGPVRPRLRLTHITANAELEQLLGSGDHNSVGLLGRQLSEGWLRYALWEGAVSAGIVIVALAAVTGLRRYSLRRTAAVLLSGTVAMTAVNLIGFGLLASGTPAALRQVHSLSDLVGRSSGYPVAPADGPTLGTIQAVVMGDSTAAGIGNRPVTGADPLDKACGRSADAFAEQLAEVNNWNVLNLACSGATVRTGLLDAQPAGPLSAPPQIAQLQRAPDARVVIVSIGADDLHWADLTRFCAASPDCDDRATDAYFQQQTAAFVLDYRELLTQLAALPNHPMVIVNQYYDPFGPDTSCLAAEDVDGSKATTLQGRLDQLNNALKQGADAAGFTSVRPSFSGHALCSAEPFVQGPKDRAPLHPNAAGELAIALADQQALSKAGK